MPLSCESAFLIAARLMSDVFHSLGSPHSETGRTYKTYDCHILHELLMSTSLLITDYSSVFFDVAYMKKPMIFYQFDVEEYRKKHFSEGYFSYNRDGMGPVVETQEALIESLKGFYDGEKFVNSEFYLERCDRFFPTHDKKNCERIYNAIKAIEQD